MAFATIYGLAGKIRISSSQIKISPHRVKIVYWNLTTHFLVYHYKFLIKFHTKILKSGWVIKKIVNSLVVLNTLYSVYPCSNLSQFYFRWRVGINQRWTSCAGRKYHILRNVSSKAEVWIRFWTKTGSGALYLKRHQ